MHIWTLADWEKYLPEEGARRTGLRFRYDPSVEPEVKQAMMEFAKWLRWEYDFPLRVVVYVKGVNRLRTMDGTGAVATFFEPYSYSDEPYIRIAAGDYDELKAKRGKDNALATILASIAHELTHYYQWINRIPLTPIGMERQATRYARFILDEYAQTREHP